MKKILRVVTSSLSLGLLKGQLHFLKSKKWDITGVSGGPEKRSMSFSLDEGVPTIVVPNLVRQISLFKDLHALFELIKIIRREKPEIVHANTPKGSLLGMMAAWICRVPVRIYSVTGLRFETTHGWFRWLLVTMERITCACATDVIPEGDGVARTLRENKITKKTLKKIHNGSIKGIDLEYFSIEHVDKSYVEDIKNKIGGNFTFIFIGRIVKDKGITELIEAFTKVNQEYPETRLLLVGRFEPKLDPLPDKTIQLIKENSAIFEAGLQNDVRPWYLAADVLTFPSYREGFPNVVLEAGAMGLPSIVTDINGSNEIIEDGKNGSIIPTHDTNTLYETMIDILNNATKREEMERVSRDIISSRYNQNDIWNALEERYKEIIIYRNKK